MRDIQAEVREIEGESEGEVRKIEGKVREIKGESEGD